MSIAFTTATPGATSVAQSTRSLTGMRQHPPGAVAAEPRRIRNEYEVDDLATWLRSSKRELPVIVVTTHFQNHHVHPDAGKKPGTRLDAVQIASDLTGIAEVIVLETGPHTERLAEIVGPMWGVYGSGARIYPTDCYWHHNPYLAPIFIKRPKQNGAQQSDEIIRRTLARDYGTTSTRPVQDWDGASMIGAARKPADFEQASKGRTYDVVETRPESNYAFASILDPQKAEALRALAEEPTAAQVLAKIAAAPPAPATQVEAVAEPNADESAAEGAAVAPEHAEPAPEPERTYREPQPHASLDARLGLSDAFELIRDAMRGSQTDTAAATTRAERAEADLRDVERQRANERIKIARLEGQLSAARAQARPVPTHAASTSGATLARVQADADSLRLENQKLRVKLSEAVDKARAAGAEARKANRGQRTGPADSLIELEIEKFPTAEDAARHAILLAWIERVPATEKAKHSLPEYTISPRFVPSLTSLTAGQLGKALRCTVDMLTGLGDDMFARQLHPLRTSDAGNAGFIQREDGAICMRAYIESNAANARRLHFWKCPNGSIELIRIVNHDDTTP